MVIDTVNTIIKTQKINKSNVQIKNVNVDCLIMYQFGVHMILNAWDVNIVTQYMMKGLKNVKNLDVQNVRPLPQHGLVDVDNNMVNIIWFFKLGKTGLNKVYLLNL